MIRAKLAEQFDVSVNWVKKSLCFKTNSKTAIKIREAALAGDITFFVSKTFH